MGLSGWGAENPSWQAWAWPTPFPLACPEFRDRKRPSLRHTPAPPSRLCLVL